MEIMGLHIFTAFVTSFAVEIMINFLHFATRICEPKSEKSEKRDGLVSNYKREQN